MQNAAAESSRRPLAKASRPKVKVLAAAAEKCKSYDHRGAAASGADTSGYNPPSDRARAPAIVSLNLLSGTRAKLEVLSIHWAPSLEAASGKDVSSAYSLTVV